MKNPRSLSPDQIAKRDARRAHFKTLWKQVADMPELNRVQLSNKLGIVTVEGRQLSLANQMLCALQCPAVSVVGGFRQWLANGRAVRKGEHGAMIWVPCGARKADVATPASEPAGDTDTRFIVGTVFDISQTDAIDQQAGRADVLAETECAA